MLHDPRVPRTSKSILLRVLCVGLLLSLPGPALAQMKFEHLVVDAAGPDDIWGKSVGDLNRDGRPDIIAGGHQGGGLVWYENPSWTRRTIAPIGSFSTDHEVCDVDRDGEKDVVSLVGSSLMWFEAPSWVDHSIGQSTLHDIEVFDLDGDGDCDVVGRNQGSFGASGATLHFFIQNSPTSWSESTRAIPDGEGLVAADLDGDEDLDLVVNEVWIENRGADLSDWAQHTYTTEWDHGFAYIAVGDIDADGDPDIVLAPSELEGGVYRISWLEAPADPKSSGWTEHVVDASVESVHHFVGVADFDRDGDMDITTAEMLQGADPDEVKIYLNDNGSWTKVVISTGGSHSMRVVDIDLDGDADLVGANHQSNQVDLWVNQTEPTPLTLDSWQRHVIDPNRPGRAIFIGADDLDGDGRVDIAAGGYWYANPGSPAGVWPRMAFGAPLNNFAVIHDFDADGDPDVLGTDGVADELAADFVYGRNDGLGGFTLFENVGAGSGDFLQGTSIARLAPGEPKSVVFSWHAYSSSVELLVVPDDPTAGAWPFESLSGSGQQEALSHGDIDRDGDEDLLLGTIWLANAGGLFVEESLYSTGDAPDRNRLGDIDRDGRLDAVIGYEAISTTGVLAWYRQPPDSTQPWEQTVIAQFIGPMSLDVADMDADGDLDVIAGEHDLENPTSAGLWVFENEDGVGGSWVTHEVYIGDEHHDGAQVVDIDGDGDLDILSIGWGHERVLLYENLAVPEPEEILLQLSGLLVLAALHRHRRNRSHRGRALR